MYALLWFNFLDLTVYKFVKLDTEQLKWIDNAKDNRKLIPIDII
jgi:hypothetical protein